MAANSTVGRVLEALLQRPQSSRYTRASSGDDIGFSFRPNAPRMITVLAAVAATVVGVSATVRHITWINERLSDAGVDLTERQGWWLLLASPVLLIAGSFLRGV